MTLSVSVYHQPEITRKLGEKFPICLSECNVFQNMFFKSMFFFMETELGLISAYLIQQITHHLM